MLQNTDTEARLVPPSKATAIMQDMEEPMLVPINSKDMVNSNKQL